MPTTHAQDRAVLSDHGLEIDASTPETWTALAADVLRGLTAEGEKHLPPKWFYDAHGSQLFDEICELPEYYLTRAEEALLRSHGAELAAAFPAQELVELGSGSSTKTPLLLEPLLATGHLQRYVPVDVSPSALAHAEHHLGQRYPDLDIERRILDFTTQLSHLGHRRGGGRLIAVLGSTIGNLEPVEVQAFLEAVRAQLGPRDAVLLGVDLVKDVATLEAAYNDSAGVTAEFNRNVLRVINRELDADFDAEAFDHESRWNARYERIETRLRANGPQRVRIKSLSLDLTFTAGETIFTEISRKFRRETVAELYAGAGFSLDAWIAGDSNEYALALARPS
ncbi:MAG: L-histidine N(alpha)-methyltransferase [Solirubrobacteraceae bacterium]|nr:L-histidine N(alpha)-methyltransferase [Solirubrobacteraceae bacterium]